MSEQKMPALPINDDTGMYYRLCCWNRATVERIQREAYEAGRQQERERLEPLRVAVEALSEAAPLYGAPSAAEIYAAAHVIATARTLLEQTE